MIEKILKKHPLFIVDVGASGGIDKRWEPILNYTVPILFEPDPRELENLKTISPENFKILGYALSNKRKKIPFHLCKKPQVSSVYEPNFELLKLFPEDDRFKIEKTIELQADTMDHLLSQNDIPNVDFIKIDTQGYELSILKGANQTLKKCIGLEIEVEFIEIYKNQPLFEKVHKYVSKLGFQMIDLRRYFWRRKGNTNVGSNKGALAFGEALYFRTPETICSHPDMNQEKIIHAAILYKSYGYLDLMDQLITNAYQNKQISSEVHQDLYRLCQSELKKDEKSYKFFQADKNLGN